MQKIGCSFCKSENPLYKKIPTGKNLLLRKVRYKVSCDDKQRMPNNIEASFDKQVKKTFECIR